jgi:hypothetical protein
MAKEHKAAAERTTSENAREIANLNKSLSNFMNQTPAAPATPVQTFQQNQMTYPSNQNGMNNSGGYNNSYGGSQGYQNHYHNNSGNNFGRGPNNAPRRNSEREGWSAPEGSCYYCWEYGHLALECPRCIKHVQDRKVEMVANYPRMFGTRERIERIRYKSPADVVDSLQDKQMNIQEMLDDEEERAYGGYAVTQSSASPLVDKPARRMEGMIDLHNQLESKFNAKIESKFDKLKQLVIMTRKEQLK